MTIEVFWLEMVGADVLPRHTSFDADKLSAALAHCEHLRWLRANEPARAISHITMVSEMPDSVGKPGVDSVSDGKTPDGLPYEWSKAGRAGNMRRTSTRS